MVPKDTSWSEFMSTGNGLDAKTGIVVDMDNMIWGATKYHEDPPAPRVGDPLHYDAFIQRLCSEYVSRSNEPAIGGHTRA